MLWYELQEIYIWIDALINYWTALTYTREEDLTARFWPANVHVMAKDILKFHAVIWPALLMAAELELPERLFVHGYLLMDEEKMSKSLGNVIDPFQVIDMYGTDALRYYLLREVNFGQDGSVSPEGFETRYSTELANEYGNLASRTLAMVSRYRDGVVPARALDPALAEQLEPLADTVRARFDSLEISAALDDIWQAVRTLNRFVQEEAPWKLAKDPEEAHRLDVVLYSVMEGLRVVSVLVHPFMPEASSRLLEALGSGGDERTLETAGFGSRPGGPRIGELSPLFPRVERAAPAAAS